MTNHSHSGIHGVITLLLVLTTAEISGGLGRLEKKVEQISPVIKTEVVENRTNKYFLAQGQKVYTMIDGKTLADYLSSKSSDNYNQIDLEVTQ